MARPTKYDPAMCDTVIDLMRVGASKTEVCAELDICFDTLMAWQEAHHEFSEAVKRGVQLCQGWWEREGRTSLRDKDFSYTGWYMNMKNRFGWKDKQETELSGTVEHKVSLEDAVRAAKDAATKAKGNDA